MMRAVGVSMLFTSGLALATDTIEASNILLILADDPGCGDVGCYNTEYKVPTPNLDRFSENEILFTDAHSPSTVCTPTRYSILTGRLAFRTGMRGVLLGTAAHARLKKGALQLETC